MIIKNMSIRQATEADAENILIWRNDSKVRRGAFNTDILPLEPHKKWLKQKISKELIYIAELNKKPFGVVCFDIDVEDWVWSFYVVPEMQGKKLGRLLMELGLLVLKQRGVELVYAEIKKDNIASLGLHTNLGFVVYSFDGNVIKYYKELNRG